MAYGGSFTCQYCGATFTWYTGKDRKGEEEARAEYEAHVRDCEGRTRH